MPPRFSLQPVLDFRHSRLEALEVELGRLLAAHQRSRASLETLRAAQNSLFDQLLRQQMGEIDLVKIDQLRANLKVVQQGITERKAELEELARQIRDKRAEVVEAKQDEEILETLKSKEAERYLAEQDHKELRRQDDIYIAQAYRRLQDNAGEKEPSP